MKLVIILGPHAVGKMTVGQELAAITGLKLFHNHMTIELVRNFFSVHGSSEGRRLNSLFRQEIFEAVAKSDLPGLIFTYMFDFDDPSEHEYINSIIRLFEAHNAETYVVELYADFNIRIERNKTENRLLHKPSKRDVEKSEELFRNLESKYRLNSYDNEVSFNNYLKIDNTNLLPNEVAMKIKNLIV
ncbi:MAG: shikimate kinase [Anaerolineaceae bacterium]|nr:MAG: shikimate kinase [Anaerolineaceae bacterium]